MKHNLVLFFCLISLFSMQAQTLSLVKGVVTDAETGELLIGVNIRIEGTHTGIVTDLDGYYQIETPAQAKLTFSYVGYKSQTISINGRKVLDVKLATNSQLVDEVVVIGYTAIKKRDVLGAVSSVNGKSLTALPVSSPAQALQGRISGVQVSNASGAPGAGVSVRIRGVGSISSGNDPLYIVDGIPIEDALNSISPNDIENITVLKDASSSAIYGSRANNGVVLITTKGGKAGRTQVTYNGQFGMQTHGRLIPMANTADYISLYNEAADADNLGSAIKRTRIEGDYLRNLDDVNHLKSIFQYAPMTMHELMVSGGNESTTYLVSGSYFGQEGIIRNSGYNRASLRANVNSQVTKWLTLGLNMSGSLSSTSSVSSSGDGYGNSEGGSVVRYAMFRNPAIPIKDNNGGYIDKPSTFFGNSLYDSFFGDGYNPVGLAENTDRTRTDETFYAKMSAQVKFPFNILWTNNFGVDYKNSSNRIYNSSWGDNNRINNPNGLSLEKNRNLNWTLNSALNYQVNINEDNHLSLMLGAEAISNTGNFLGASDQDFPIWDKDVIYIGGGLGKKISSENEWTTTLASFFGQFSYDYKQRYYVSGTLRRDGTSRFIGDNKWGTFYSVSGGWNIENESFMQEVDFINKLKIRGGWGAIGNQNVGIYAYSDRYSPDFNYPFGGTSYRGYAQTQLGNPNLKWETSKQFNVGLDVEFMKGTYALTVDFYNKITADMLVEAPLPPSVGFATPSWINSGKVLNRGVDLEFLYRKRYNDGGFEIALNGGFLHNEVLELDAPIEGGRIDNGVYATKTQVGYPIGSFFLYEMDGIFQNKTDILTSAFQDAATAPGDVKYVDHNKDGKITAEDRVHVGSSIPVATMGLNLSADWKGFDLSLFFQGAFGQKIYNQILTDSEGFYRGFAVTQRYFDNHWTGEGSTNQYPRASWKAKSNNVKASTRFLEDGSYLRLKNVQLGYNFSLKNKGVDRLRIYLAATNLFTISKYSGFDPEMTTSANSAAEGDRAGGIDWGTYPVPITYTLGLNLVF